MQTIWIIGQREYKRYFSTPAAYLIAFFLLLIMGLIFYANLASGVLQQFAPDMRDVFGILIFLLVITLSLIHIF